GTARSMGTFLNCCGEGVWGGAVLPCDFCPQDRNSPHVCPDAVARMDTSKRSLENESLLTQIRKIHQKSHQRYGSPRITEQLKREEKVASRPRVARLMKGANIRSKGSKKYKQTTDSNHELTISPNLLKRQFETSRLGQVWVSDISYLWTDQGWGYLTVIIDLADRQVIGWAVSEEMTTEQTVLAAWKMAVKNRPPESGLIFHSDRGSQYATTAFRQHLVKHQVCQSMSRKGDCWDKAVAEFFFKTLKAEIGYQVRFPSLLLAQLTIFEFIEIWYNRQRIHSSIGYKTPVEMQQYLQNLFNNKAAFLYRTLFESL
ncbi:MAG: IS3 family transposase, partial [Bacteroidota bacterium]